MCVHFFVHCIFYAVIPVAILGSELNDAIQVFRELSSFKHSTVFVYDEFHGDQGIRLKLYTNQQWIN